jgi:hypothetical protein
MATLQYSQFDSPGGSALELLAKELRRIKYSSIMLSMLVWVMW